MEEKKQKKQIDPREKQKARVAEVVNTFEWLITAFILAFVFRAFAMEAFRIPTGSMADTLMGAHFHLCCPECGYKYKYGFDPMSFDMTRDSVPSNAVKMPVTKCPSCGYFQTDRRQEHISYGDRILVLKCLYQFRDPKRWDVVVFKNPLNPKINYIKRLIGKPNEKVEIIDGDIYINDEIQRKPQKVQQELWMPVFDNDFQPARPNVKGFNGHTWSQPFNTIGSKWQVDENDKTAFRLNSDSLETMFYDTTVGNDFYADYAYNDVRLKQYMPICSDIMVRCNVKRSSQMGKIQITITKYTNTYSASYNFDGTFTLSRELGMSTKTLDSGKFTPLENAQTKLVKFAVVDHMLIFQVGDEVKTFSLGTASSSLGPKMTKLQPKVEITGAGNLKLSHLAIFRDIHYTSEKIYNIEDLGRAVQGQPLTLKKDQFFVLGDNSPNSEDGRWWKEQGIGNNGKKYRAGIVPRDYLVGKALYVYWPGGFRLKMGRFKTKFAVIPNIGDSRFIYGGGRNNPQD